MFYWTFKKEELYMLKVAIYSEKYRIVFVRKVESKVFISEIEIRA